jgi:drug/metabolite transporter (DMT)-like permease
VSANALWGLVLFSAVAHAAWNSLVKSAGDRVLTMVSIRLVGLGLGLAALPFVAWPDAESWKWLALTALIQFAYYALLVRSYALGDMSVVYPLARGTAPLLTALGAIVVLDERLSTAHFAAVALISIGILALSIRSGAGRAAVGFACATGVSVAGYSLFGGLGVRTAGTVVGFQACLEIVTGSGMVAYGLATRRESFVAFARKRAAVGLLAGSLSVLGYLAFLAAAQSLPLGPIVALRETSVIFGTLIGTFVLQEAFALRRIMASAFVLTGVSVLALVR